MTVITEAQATVPSAERCTGTKRDGTPCTRIAVTDTSAGLRCSHHDPDRAQVPKEDRPKRPRALRLPVTELRSPADALALSSWAALMVLRGRLSPRVAQVAKGMLAEWRQAFRDSGVMAEFAALRARVAELTAAKSP